MLILLLGPSGVGKTSLIHRLVRDYGWSPIFSLVTREPRSTDDFKIHLSIFDYESLVKHGKLWSDVSQLGHRYGTFAAEVEAAAIDRTRNYVLDFSRERCQEFFGSLPHIELVVLPEKRGCLENHLLHASRGGRIENALAELDAFEREIAAGMYSGSCKDVVTSYENNMAKTVEELLAKVKYLTQ